VTDPVDPALERALTQLAMPGLMVGHRVIQPNDNAALLPAELATIPTSDLLTRRASGAARIVARQFLAELGYGEPAIPKRVNGCPLWPSGITGSFAHDERVCVIAVGRLDQVGSVGIDVEPADDLPEETFDLIATAAEKSFLGGDLLAGRLLFAAKEAVYKSLYPLDGQFLEFHDIEVDFEKEQALVKSRRSVDLRFCESTHLVALALAR
jgi:4'-phosphopantetheinyl transferase EntD